MVRLSLGFVVTLAVACAATAPVAAQTDPYDAYRIFLRDGEALPSHGDYAVVDGRVVFTLPIGAPGEPPELQLMSLPTSVVDLDRTSRYARSLRAARYAAVRGEADYLAVTDEVSRALDQLRDVEDTARRLELAVGAKRRLLDWSRDHFSYRAADIRELAGLFDEVIAELRVAAGETTFSFDVTAGLPEPAGEPLLDLPTRGRSVELALRAARETDVVEERLAILRAAASAVADAAGADPLRAAVERELAAELAADEAYAALEAGLLARAEAALARGDVPAIEALGGELADGDRALGQRRVHRVRALRSRLSALAEAALAHRLALDRYAMTRAARLAYERRIRPVSSGLDGLTPVLEAVRDRRGLPFASLERARARLADLAARLGAITAPADLADVHATLSSAVLMAGQAATRWRAAVISENTSSAAEASAAASGALLLAARSREVLLERLFPPAPPVLAGSGRPGP
jgi:hypothetical protein